MDCSKANLSFMGSHYGPFGSSWVTCATQWQKSVYQSGPVYDSVSNRFGYFHTDLTLLITAALMATLLLLSSWNLCRIFVLMQRWIFKIWIAQCSPPLLSFYHATLFPLHHSPLLASFFPKHRFHFHISAESAGSLRVLMQQAEGSEAILWSRSHNTVSHWTSEHLPLGLHHQPYKVCAWVST